MKVVGFVGMPGCGKSEAADVARSMGIPVVIMGDVVRKEVRSTGLEIVPETLRKAMIEMRRKYGKGVVAERCLPLVRALSTHKMVAIDGIRSPEEIDVFRREFPGFFVIAIHSSPRTRFRRLQDRRRGDDPDTWKQFCERDNIELSVGIGGAIALADAVVSNEGNQPVFRKNVKRILLEVATNDQSTRGSASLPH
ncbi:MAG: AAA family ATPase [Promethearchaeati archaeon SRVP18_Atabeyarchaeia-1]